MTQTQREALLDLLILSIFADSHLSLGEDEVLQASYKTVGWDSPKPRDIFISTSMSRGRKAAESDDDMAAYISVRAAAFTDAESQAAALELIGNVLSGDGLAPSETVFLGRIRAAFGGK